MMCKQMIFIVHVTPEYVKVQIRKNPYKDDIISFAEKFNKEGKEFLDGYNQPILESFRRIIEMYLRIF